MLSKRELLSLRRLADEYKFPQVDAELLKELLDSYEQNHSSSPPKLELVPKPEEQK